jgi:hypothetical protein
MKKWILLAINLVGGTAVLGSYVLGFRAHPDAGQVLWGGVPESLRSLYTINMFLAAAGYFCFAYFIFFKLPEDRTRIANRFGFNLFTVLFVLILVPSALWLPLTFLTLENSSVWLVWLVRLDLWVVAAASLALLVSLVTVKPNSPAWAHRLALIGMVFFSL